MGYAFGIAENQLFWGFLLRMVRPVTGKVARSYELSHPKRWMMSPEFYQVQCTEKQS